MYRHHNAISACSSVMSCKDGGALLPGGSGLQQSKQETVGMKAEGHRLERLFHQLDTNGDGRIDIHELFQGLNRLGYAHISEEQVEVRRHFFHQQKSACRIIQALCLCAPFLS